MGIAESWLSHTVRSAGGSCPTRFRGLSRLRPENRAAMSLRLKELASVYLTDQDSASLANGAHRAVRCLDFEPEAGPSPACRAPRAAGCQCISKLEYFAESMICRYTSPPCRERVWPKAVSDLSARKVSRSPMPQDDPGMSFRFSRTPLEAAHTHQDSGRAGGPDSVLVHSGRVTVAADRLERPVKRENL